MIHLSKSLKCLNILQTGVTKMAMASRRAQNGGLGYSENLEILGIKSLYLKVFGDIFVLMCGYLIVEILTFKVC